MLSLHDQLMFECDSCYMPHLFHVTFNEISKSEESKISKTSPRRPQYKSVLQDAVWRKRNNRWPAGDESIRPLNQSFSQHLKCLMSPVGYEDDFVTSEKAVASGDFMAATGSGSSEFVDTSSETGLWSSNLKETLKKYLFLFGFGRLGKLRKVSDVLSRQPLE